MDLDDIRFRINSEPDYIHSARFNNSLVEFLERYPEGAPLKVIGHCLAMTEEEIEGTYEKIIEKLRLAMKVDE
jgi:hypothetical protein